jgi:hypothetical protein
VTVLFVCVLVLVHGCLLSSRTLHRRGGLCLTESLPWAHSSPSTTYTSMQPAHPSSVARSVTLPWTDMQCCDMSVL